jgi:hypothetical protein
VPLNARIEPAELFERWLVERLHVGQTSSPALGTGNPLA